MVNVVVAKPPPEPPFLNNSEIWMQGPEPYTTKIVDVTNQPALVNNLALDQWYDFYARAPANATGDAGVGFFTINVPGFPQPNNPEQYLCGWHFQARALHAAQLELMDWRLGLLPPDRRNT
jgi:hypothetical protein